jgi:excisionase family DNA binding protein
MVVKPSHHEPAEFVPPNLVAVAGVHHTVTSPYLTVREVAELARCEHKAVRRAITDGRLRAFQPANRLLIREDDALAWIEGSPTVVPADRPPQRRRTSRSSRAVVGSVADLKAIERQVTTT